MYGIYLKCEQCGATIGGEQVTQNPEPPLGRFKGVELRARAAALGWKFVPPDSDYCPTCSSGVKENDRG
jgi:hypothetical protein